MKKTKSECSRRDSDLRDEISLDENSDIFMKQNILHFLKNYIQCCRELIDDSDTFDPIDSVISASEVRKLISASTTSIILEEIKTEHRYGRVDFENDSPKEILQGLWNHPKANRLLRQPLVKLIEKYLSNMQQRQKSLPVDPIQVKFEEIRNAFKLDEREYNILLLCAALWGRTWWRVSCGYRDESAQVKLRRMSAALAMNLEELTSMVGCYGRLRRYNCIDSDLSLNGVVMQFIFGLHAEPLMSRYYNVHKEVTLPWDYYGELTDKHGMALQKMVKNCPPDRGINILFYGTPGTGKSSFAFTLAARLGLTAYNIAQSVKDSSINNDRKEAESNYSANFRFAALQICDSQVDHEQSIIVIDEADEMLAGEHGGGFMNFIRVKRSEDRDKGMLNSVLDTLKTPCIWIANTESEMIALSSRRRFDYSIKFNPLTQTQRRLIWQNAIAKHKLGEYLPDSLVEKLTLNYEISAGGIDLALRNFRIVHDGEGIKPEQAEQLIETFLKPHCELMGANGSEEKWLNVAADYSLEGLNLNGSVPLERIVTAVTRFRNEQNVSTSTGIDKPRMNLLLSGPPGTGKTEFVKYLGKTLNAKIMVKMGSDLLDKYVGGTEQNIARAFREAENQKAILFLDEVDGLLRSRQMADRRWEVTEVNELLHQMENFNGVLICATNFVDNLDPATIRRFTFKLEFNYLTDDGKLMFFRKMLGLLYPDELHEQERRRLSMIPQLTPGDFRTVRQACYYLGNENGINAGELIDALEREYCARKSSKTTGKPIGFIQQGL